MGGSSTLDQTPGAIGGMDPLELWRIIPPAAMRAVPMGNTGIRDRHLTFRTAACKEGMPVQKVLPSLGHLHRIPAGVIFWGSALGCPSYR